MAQELKQRMTIEEMSRYMQENSFYLPSRVATGKYAKKLGYRVYKPMQNGRVLHLYVKDEQEQPEQSEEPKDSEQPEQPES